MPAPLTYVAGVQIGRCESRVCVVRREASGELTTVQFVQSDTGARSTPCVIALSATGEYVIGEAAETQMAKNADATVPDVAGDVEIVLTPPPNEDEDEPPAKPGKLRGEDGAAKVLGRLKSLVDDFLGVEGNEALCCVVAVPSTILGDAVAMASLKRAAKAAKLECLSWVSGPPPRTATRSQARRRRRRRRARGRRPRRGLRRLPPRAVERRAVARPEAADGARRPRDGEALYGHCVTFLKRRQKIDVAEGGKKAQRKLRVACVRAAKPLISEAATKVAKGAKKYASARADFCLATAALPVLGGGLRVAPRPPAPATRPPAAFSGAAKPLAPKGSPVPATHAASLELAGDGAAAFVVAFDGARAAVLDCSKFAGASKVELAATLDEKANLKLVPPSTATSRAPSTSPRPPRRR
ncbi:ATP binding protein [Aureococcus anophagefferens]|nr:ATP binding protein [Aureococcus anophagefferens]